MDHLPKIEGEPYQHKDFPAWAEGPHGEREIFDSEAEVPAGWTHHGKTKAGTKESPTPPVSKPAPPAPPPPPGSPDVDASGAAFDPELHAATRTKTGAGLWRMKVGVSRPAISPPPPPATDL